MDNTDDHYGLESEMDNDNYNAQQYFNGSDDDEHKVNGDRDEIEKETSRMVAPATRALELRPKRDGSNEARADRRGGRRGGRGGRALASWTRRERTLQQCQATVERALESGTETVVPKAKGETISHVSKAQFEHAVKLVDRNTYDVVKNYEGVSVRSHDFDTTRFVVRFLVYWINYHDTQNAHAAIEYALSRTIDINKLKPKLGAEIDDYVMFLAKVINFFAGKNLFNPQIKESLFAYFAELMKSQNDREGKIEVAEMFKGAFDEQLFQHIVVDVLVALSD